MQENDARKTLDQHIFICTKCQCTSDMENPNHATELRMELKNLCSKEIPGQSIRVNAAGCLGVCDEGIHAVIYPQQKWFKKLSKESIPELIKYLKSGI